MSLVTSRPFEELVRGDGAPHPVHTLIVGSGYGAAFAALALAMRGDKPYANREILVLERGNEYVPGDFPKTVSDLPAHLSVQPNGSDRTGYADALFDLRVGENVISIVGSGLGGTSLINAGVAVDPTPDVFDQWPQPDVGGDWATRLAPSLRFVHDVLATSVHPNAQRLPKVMALKALAATLEGRAKHEVPPVAVAFAEGVNHVGVEQPACTNCGNCFTGCNIGAKSTLAMNAWPLARRLGVDIVTGGTVLEVVPVRVESDPAWVIIARSTTDTRRRARILAHRVILAAGTFGSTEILHRSSAALGLDPSVLGARFSLNGDGIAFGFGQRAPVQACATVPSSVDVTPGSDDRPGPTIVSMVRLQRQGRRGLIEDATVPQAISRLWGEILSTQAMTSAYVSDTPSAWHSAHAAVDPLAMTADLMRHHQVLLTMGTDEANGTIAFDNDRLRIAWPRDSEGADSWFREVLSAAHRRGGFDGGLHLDNPFWKPLPEGFDAVFEGASQLGGTHLCNHPLGGCAMGTDPKTGVVNTDGQVFGPRGEPLPGLYVLDGSIIPGALGINPMMTIAALAHCLALQMDGPPAAIPPSLPSIKPPVRFDAKRGRVVAWPVPRMSFEFSERLFGPIAAEDARRIGALLGAKAEAKGIVIDALVQLPDVYAWLADPSVALDAEFKLYIDARASETIDTVPDTHLGAPLATSKGWVRWLARVKGGPSQDGRAIRAIERFLMMRGDEVWGSASGGIGAFMRVARQHAEWRDLQYGFTADVGGRTIFVSGTKLLAYDGRRPWDVEDEANLWTSLTRLALQFSDAASGKKAKGVFRVDLVRMAHHLDPLQHTGHAETPQVVVAAASVAAFFARAVVQTHLWSFGAPSYDKLPSHERANEGRLSKVSQVVYWWEGRKHRFALEPAGQTSEWRLLRAKPLKPDSNAAPILLIHGLAHSSRVFCTETIDRNLAGHLLMSGREVWLLDHGLSTSLPSPAVPPSIDDIAGQVAEAVLHVHAQTGKRVDVFSHCVGSAALTMAILSGRLSLKHGGSAIRSLAMHAVPPWIQASESNLLRARIGAFFKDRFFPAVFDPIPYDPAKTDSAGHPGPEMPLGHLVLDRFASSLPWPKADFEHHSLRDSRRHFARTICNRMTALYGYEWSHDRLDRRTHPAVATLVGPANADSYRQLYYLLTRGRVTDREGVNRYVLAQHFIDHWDFPTLFIHGSQNKVFDVESARLAAHQLAALQNKRQTVDLRIVEGYGHMDLLFGENAWDHVFRHLVPFFDHGGSDARDEPPKTPTGASKRIVTGPVISRPVERGDRRFLRLWCESDAFQTSTVERIDFLMEGHPLPAEPLGGAELWQHSNVLNQSNFWLYDVECSEVAGPVTPHVISQEPAIKFAAPAGDGTVDWSALPWFRRFLDGNADGLLSFVIGSCRYPGFWFDSHISDRIYELVREHVTQGRGIDHVLLVGDQIYADATYSLFDIGEHRERFQESYRRAFNSVHQRWVLGHVPSYLAVDDHEFTNNYRAVSILGGNLGVEPESSLGSDAAQEAWNYQMHHGVVPDQATNHLWYAFGSAGYECFVFDTRSERRSSAGPERIVSARQRQGFREWLQRADKSGRPIFLVTGSPLAPLPRDEVLHPARAQLSDTLRAYPEFLGWLVSELESAAIRIPVVLLSGDPHLSALCEVQVRDAGRLRCTMLCIVASGANAPLPFANDPPDDYLWTDATFVPVGATLAVQVPWARLLSVSRAHVLRVDVEPDGESGWCLAVTVVDAHGRASEPWRGRLQPALTQAHALESAPCEPTSP